MQDKQGDTVIHYAMQKQDLNLLKQLRNENVFYDRPVNIQGETPLMVAFSVDPNASFIQELLQDKDFFNQDISVVLKYSLEKLGAKQTSPARQLMNSVITQKDAKVNPSSLFYKALLDKNNGAVKSGLKKILALSR